MDVLFEKIRADAALSPFLKSCCEDEGMSVEMDSSITPEMFVILKPDDYYNSLHLPKTPASPDCLILQQCVNGGYAVTLVELKNIKSAQDVKVEEIVRKFQTCLENFMSVRFEQYFLRDYERIVLYFVTKIGRTYQKDKGLTLETLIDRRFTFRHRKNLMIRLEMPTPAIKPCYHR